MNEKKINEIIYSAIDNANESDDYDLKKDLDSPLYGNNSKLDSLGLVSLLAEIEEMIGDEIQKPISLMSEKAMSRFKSPFNNVGVLTDYIKNLIEEGEND